MDTLEALSNAVIGLLVSAAITHYVLGFPAMESAGITAMFFAVSFARARILRAIFRRIGQ